MINPFAEVNWKPERAERRKFALGLILGFPCLALVCLLAGRLFKGSWDANLHLGLGLALGGGGAGGLFWCLPRIAWPFYVIWYFVACCLGLVLGNLLLGGFYFVVLTPIALVRRVVSKSALNKGFNKQAETYWHDAPPVKDPAAYYKQY